MIANDSSGARTPVYGTTAEHVRSLELVLADGRVETTGSHGGTLAPLREFADQLIRHHAAAIAERMPAGVVETLAGLRHQPVVAGTG